MKKITIELIVRDDDDGVLELQQVASDLEEGYTGGHSTNDFINSYSYTVESMDSNGYSIRDYDRMDRQDEEDWERYNNDKLQ